MASSSRGPDSSSHRPKVGFLYDFAITNPKYRAYIRRNRSNIAVLLRHPFVVAEIGGTSREGFDLEPLVEAEPAQEANPGISIGFDQSKHRPIPLSSQSLMILVNLSHEIGYILGKDREESDESSDPYVPHV